MSIAADCLRIVVRNKAALHLFAAAWTGPWEFHLGFRCFRVGKSWRRDDYLRQRVLQNLRLGRPLRCVNDNWGSVEYRQVDPRDNDQNH
jgi:hypothetical protein